MEKLSFLGPYINSQFQKISSQNLKKHISPGDFKDFIFEWNDEPDIDLDSLCLAGIKAYEKWARTPLEKRVEKLKPLKELIKKNAKALAEVISRETGKALWESEGEIKALMSKVDFVLNQALKRIETMEVPEAKGRVRFKSRGLCLVIGPFNFPMHLPFGQILPALVSGNAVIFKPSEKAPASAQKLTEIFNKLSLEPGLFQMIPGNSEISKKLCEQELISSVFFTGSFEVGQKIKKALLPYYSKLLALEMGGCNNTLIWKDSDIDLAVKECLKACFWTAGQRCTSTSQIILHEQIATSFIKKFIEETKKISVDHWSKNPFMGSLIDLNAIEKFFAFQDQVKKEGGEFLLEGQRILKEKGFYVRPGIYKMNFDKNSSFGKEEIFTPQVVIYKTNKLASALDMIHHSGFGLSLSVFSKDKKLKEDIFHLAKVGLIYYNLASVGASGLLPFGGWGKSGNDRPAGAFAIDSCVFPVAERDMLL